MERGHGGRLCLPLADPILQQITEEEHERQADIEGRDPQSEIARQAKRALIGPLPYEIGADERDEHEADIQKGSRHRPHMAAGRLLVGRSHFHGGLHRFISIQTVSRGTHALFLCHDRIEVRGVIEETETHDRAIVDHISFMEEAGGGRVVERGERVEDAAAALFQGNAVSVQPSPWDGICVHGVIRRRAFGSALHCRGQGSFV